MYACVNMLPVSRLVIEKQNRRIGFEEYGFCVSFPFVREASGGRKKEERVNVETNSIRLNKSKGLKQLGTLFSQKVNYT